MSAFQHFFTPLINRRLPDVHRSLTQTPLLSTTQKSLYLPTRMNCESVKGKGEMRDESLLVLVSVVSSCRDGEFQCGSGECVPVAVTRDITRNCEDGSDEEFCASGTKFKKSKTLES
ncbi:hypothetical protein CRUP_036265 [Coryphaenoides rupestris]|nr:hypothetical protein CRUP_036265 [Coryphaenoides rupestris]